MTGRHRADGPADGLTDGLGDGSADGALAGAGASSSAAVRIGTRGSALALTQTGHVAEALVATGALGGRAVDLVRVRTEGDRLRGPLAALGGAGVFVAALREAVLDGRCDVAVHSLKDLPTAPAEGLVVAAVPERVDHRDALCARDGLTLQGLPEGARVGTGSPRRAAQLRGVRPDLDVVDIRGNVDTRLGRVPGLGEGPGDLDAVVLAAAGLTRLGRLDAVSELLAPSTMAPAPGQGALAVECRTGSLTTDPGLAAALRALDHLPTRLAVTAERELLTALEAGCAAPVGAAGHVDDDGHLTLDVVVARVDGTAHLRTSASVRLPEEALRDRPGTGRADLDVVGRFVDLVVPDDDVRAAELTDRLVATARTLGRRVAEQMLAEGVADLAPLGPGRTS
ncbi:porphobilinogen deaminase [Cellulomonas carbonis]|nr:porphobilinogen deaminase [Cellulomonas carbonis]